MYDDTRDKFFVAVMFLIFFCVVFVYITNKKIDSCNEKNGEYIEGHCIKKDNIIKL